MVVEDEEMENASTDTTAVDGAKQPVDSQERVEGITVVLQNAQLEAAQWDMRSDLEPKLVDASGIENDRAFQ